MASVKEKSLGVALLLNLVIPGAGYMYMGRVVAGVLALLIVPPIIFFTAGVAWIGWAIVMSIDMMILHGKHKKELLAATTKTCPKCAERVQREAKVCRFCQTIFEAAA